MKKQTYTFSDLEEIIRALRSENGCPWDREQTHESLRPCMTEEAAELVAAVRIFRETGDDENLCEELGDVLLQVMLHSQIASEDGRFDVQQVIQKISEKMIRRHPHVFGDRHAENAGQALERWDEIKKEEKKGQSWVKGELREIPIELPALIRAQKVIKKSEKTYGRENVPEENICSIKENLEILKMETDFKKKEKAAGNLLLAAAGISRYYGVHAEQALTDTIEELIDDLEGAQG